MDKEKLVSKFASAIMEVMAADEKGMEYSVKAKIKLEGWSWDQADFLLRHLRENVDGMSNAKRSAGKVSFVIPKDAAKDVKRAALHAANLIRAGKARFVREYRTNRPSRGYKSEKVRLEAEKVADPLITFSSK